MGQTGPSAGSGRARRPRLYEQRIGDGEIVEDRLVGPLARLLSGQGAGRVGQRAELGRGGRETQVIEDLPDDCYDFASGSTARGGLCTHPMERDS